jgi:hypothetical protein
MSMDRIAGITSNTVPWEILRAAGYAPRLLEDEAGPTPFADRWMEDVFDPRIRVIFDRLCSGAWNHLDRVVIPRTSEQEHKLYLYLREMARTQAGSAIPELYLYNLLHTRTPESYDYGLERTREMIRDFKASVESLRDAIAESNRARGCVRQILHKRREGFLEGSVAMEWLRGFYTEDRSAFADGTVERLAGMAAPVANGRPRIVIKGAPLSESLLHRAVEDAGGYVSAEDDWRGSRAAGDFDVRTDADAATAIFEKYHLDEMSPRIQPSHHDDIWFQREIESGTIDGVLFYIPLQDDVVGWDYPRHYERLQQRGIASEIIRGRDAGQLEAFIGSIRGT